MRARWLLAAAGALVTAASVGTLVPAQAATPNEQTFSGYSTGTVQHASLLDDNITADAAWSGASVASRGLGTFTQGPDAAPGTIVNEMRRTVQGPLPGEGKLAGTRSFALGDPLNVLDASIPARSEVSAPPSVSDEQQLINQAIDTLAYASVLRSTTQANWNDNSCILGKPISEGIGYAADAQLIGGGNQFPDGSTENPIVATDDGVPTSERVNQSTSRTLLVPQVDAAGASLGNKLGLRSETRQIIAPVTLFKGTANEISIDVAGEWVLQATAGGVANSAVVHYGPGQVSPSTTVLGITLPGADPILVTLQDILGTEGLQIPIPGLGEIVIGEPPRAIGGEYGSAPLAAANGTQAGAAVDVVRVIVNPGAAVEVAEVRIGHMEAFAQAPPGGIECTIPVTKAGNPAQVVAGENFTWNIKVTNTFDCTLTGVKVVDTMTQDPGVTYTIGDTVPGASAKTGNTVTWNDVGPIAPGQSKDLSIKMSVNSGSAPGKIFNNVAVTANCAFGSGSGLTDAVVPLTGAVNVTETVEGRELPITGGSSGPLAILAGGLMALALFARPTLRKAEVKTRKLDR